MKRKTVFGGALAAALLLGMSSGGVTVATAHPQKGDGHKSDSPQRQMMHQMMRDMHGCMQQRMKTMSAAKADGAGQMDRSAMRMRMMEMMKGCMAEMEKMPHGGGAMGGHGGMGHKDGRGHDGTMHKKDAHKH